MFTTCKKRRWWLGQRAFALLIQLLWLLPGTPCTRGCGYMGFGKTNAVTLSRSHCKLTKMKLELSEDNRIIVASSLLAAHFFYQFDLCYTSLFQNWQIIFIEQNYFEGLHCYLNKHLYVFTFSNVFFLLF